MPWFIIELTVTAQSSATAPVESAEIKLPAGVIEEWYLTPTIADAINLWAYFKLNEVPVFPRNKVPNDPYIWVPNLGNNWTDHYEILEKPANLKLVAYNLAQTGYTVMAGCFINTAKLREKERRVGYASMPTEVSNVKQPQVP